jgi:hypothetical protein
MFNRIANRHTKREQQDLTSSIKCCTKDDITYWPSVFKCTEDEDELGDDVDGDTDERPDDVDYEERNGFGVRESKKLFEGGYGDEKGDAEYK